MPNLNKCMFIGNAGRDPEVRYTAAGKATCNLSIAVNYGSGDNATTEWINLVFWEKLAEVVGEYVTKGSPIFVEGRLQTRKWEDKDGNDRYTTEVVVGQMQLLGSRDGGGDRQERGVRPEREERDDRARGPGGQDRDSRPAPRREAQRPAARPAARQAAPASAFDDMDDDIPF